MGLLETIHESIDLKRLRLDQLVDLAEEIRQRLLDVTSKNGGHLASNLGVVELTIAIHYVFNLPKDKLILDVGHQSYVHKLLTGRQDEFDSIRQFGGLSGFPKREESIYDCFDTGHAGTAISAAMGFASARDLAGGDEQVVALIGDGTMSVGMTYEALNQAGAKQSKLVIILNDNNMFISQHVGAMSNYLNKIRSRPGYESKKHKFRDFLLAIPLIGKGLYRLADKLRNILKAIWVPGLLFEELGITYLGPVDGHDIKACIDLLEQAKQRSGPVLVHVMSKKGRGYTFAEKDPASYHGVGPFDQVTGKALQSEQSLSYSQIFADTIFQLAAQDPKIVGVTAAMEQGTGLDRLGKAFPDRLFDVGIAEQHAITFAAGLALAGLKPVVSMYSTFYQRAFDQVLHDVCLQNAPVVMVVDRAGLVGEDGPTHHGIFDVSFLRAIPNLIMLSPKDENELQDMLYSAFCYQQPVVIRFPKASTLGARLEKDFQYIPPGRAELIRPGHDLTLVAFGPLVGLCQAAVDELAKEGIEAGLINLRSLNPLDHDLLISEFRQSKGLLVVEDHILMGGVGSAILEFLSDAGITDLAVKRIGYHNFVEHGDLKSLYQKYGITVKHIVMEAKSLLDQSSLNKY